MPTSFRRMRSPDKARSPGSSLSVKIVPVPSESYKMIRFMAESTARIFPTGGDTQMADFIQAGRGDKEAVLAHRSAAESGAAKLAITSATCRQRGEIRGRMRRFLFGQS